MMGRALELAKLGESTCSPNPMVGAVVTRNGEVVGEGYHQVAGGPHAEVNALRQAGGSARGGDLFVTLEPCAHQGRTPACSAAVIEAGIERVFAAHCDPNPEVAGGGFEVLKEAGIAVEVGILAEEAALLNWRFLVNSLFGRPAVSLKWAMSLDGKIATVEGHSQWISSPEGREWGLMQRENHDAILVGSGTMESDDPRLNRRQGKATGPITRVILDRRLRTSPRAAIFSLPGPVLVYTEAADATNAGLALRERGAQVISLPEVEASSVLADLHTRGVRSLLVEGGPTVSWTFVHRGLVDRVAVNCAPLVIGGADALGALGGTGFRTLPESLRLARLESEPRGADLIITGFTERCLQELSSVWED